jgi:hypothetical protein
MIKSFIYPIPSFSQRECKAQEKRSKILKEKNV